MLTALKRKLKFGRSKYWVHGPRYSYAISYEPDCLLAALRNKDGTERRVRLRPGSDGPVFTSIFGNEEYSTEKMARNTDLAAVYAQILKDGRRPLIIDAGANVGLASMYFRDIYPDAAIVAVEPEAGNFAELEARVGDDPLVLPLRAALSSDDGMLDVVDPGEGAWGFRTGTVSGQAASATVPAYSPASLLSLAAGHWPVEPLIFKIDIEGFEAQLFESTDLAWIDRLPLIIIELHDWMLPGKGNSRSFLKAMAERDRDFVYVGENVFSFRN